MPAHRLIPQTASPGTPSPETPTPAATPRQMADAVLTVLSGMPAHLAAAAINVPVTQLSDAVEAYKAAGYQALEAQTADNGWYSVYLHFPDWDTAEEAAATALAPGLDRLNDSGKISRWWFIRKKPCWRLRLRLGDKVTPDQARSAVNAMLDDLVTSKVISRWWPVIYEPETAAFGGALGIKIAHTLFHADSRHILYHLRRLSRDAIGRRELSILLCATMLSAAGLDRFERGDVWHRVAVLRPLPAAAPLSKLEAMADRLRPLLAAPIDQAAPAGSCAWAMSWAAAFGHAGRSLRSAASTGRLDRGVRHVLTHLVIFHWNRLGLSATSQAILSRAAREALLPS